MKCKQEELCGWPFGDQHIPIGRWYLKPVSWSLDQHILQAKRIQLKLIEGQFERVSSGRGAEHQINV